MLTAQEAFKKAKEVLDKRVPFDYAMSHIQKASDDGKFFVSLNYVTASSNSYDLVESLKKQLENLGYEVKTRGGGYCRTILEIHWE